MQISSFAPPGILFRRILMKICQTESFGCSPPSRPPRNHQEPPENLICTKNKVLLLPLILPLEGREGKPPVQTFQEDPSLDILPLDGRKPSCEACLPFVLVLV